MRIASCTAGEGASEAGALANVAFGEPFSNSARRIGSSKVWVGEQAEVLSLADKIRWSREQAIPVPRVAATAARTYLEEQRGVSVGEEAAG